MNGRALAKVLIAVAVVTQLTGCFALNLATRGAPPEAVREIVLALDPVDVPVTHGHGHEGAVLTTPLWTTMPEKAWVHGWDFEIEDEDGNAVPRSVIHHFKVMRPDRRELTRPIMLHLAGAGAETTGVDVGLHVGYPMEQGDSLLVTAMLHNPTHEELDGVQLTIRLKYSPEGPWRSPQTIVPFFAHLTPPMQVASYDLEPGVSERTVEIRPTVSGRLLGLGGHLHRYGISMRLEDPQTGALLWQVESVRDDEGEVLAVPQARFVWQRGPRLEAGRSYRVTAVYDNPTGEVIPEGGMATLGGAIIPDDLAEWPVVDRTDPDYQWYLDVELHGMPMSHGSGS